MIDPETGDLMVRAVRWSWVIRRRRRPKRCFVPCVGEFKEFPLLGAETLKMLGGTYNPTWTADTKAMLQVCGLSVSHVEVKDGLITIE